VGYAAYGPDAAADARGRVDVARAIVGVDAASAALAQTRLRDAKAAAATQAPPDYYKILDVRARERASEADVKRAYRALGAFYVTLVPIRPRSRGKRRSLRTLLPGVSLRPHLAFNPDTPRRLSTSTDAFQLQRCGITRTSRRGAAGF
jgi:hypothetical protein